MFKFPEIIVVLDGVSQDKCQVIWNILEFFLNCEILFNLPGASVARVTRVGHMFIISGHFVFIFIVSKYARRHQE